MNRIHFLIAVCVLALSSCSTYKNSQTPDDVYYSPNSQRHGAYAASNNGEYYSTPNDQYVHMLVQNPARWSYFDDYNYDYNGGFASCFSSFGTFMYGYTPWVGFGYNYWYPYSYWNSYYTWNSYYNPYYTSVVIANPKAQGVVPVASSPYTHLSTFSPTSYTNNIYNRRNLTAVGSASPHSYTYGETIRTNYNNNLYYNNNRNIYNRSNNGYYSQPSRSYSPSPFGSSGGSMRTSGSGGFGGGGMSRPAGGRH